MARRRHPAPIEHSILLTATLCLLAYGAVMVYSASSARTLLQGQGDGSAFLVKYVIYGTAGFVLMHLVARQGLDKALRCTGPLLALAFVCLLAVKLPASVTLGRVISSSLVVASLSVKPSASVIVAVTG